MSRNHSRPVWHDGRLTDVAFDHRSVTLTIDLVPHYNGGSFCVATARVTGIQNVEEARAFFASLPHPTVAAPLGVLDVRTEGDAVGLHLSVGSEARSFRFVGARLKAE
ncbi:MAG: hypothetical protein ABMA64_06635 [Myxococcota bacterium]